MKQLAPKVWLVTGGFPGKRMNVYLIENSDGESLTVFDAGVRSMVKTIQKAAAELGKPITRVVLGHGHPDHRGAAPGLGVPVYCHSAERADAEGDGGVHYFDFSLLKFIPARFTMPCLLKRWDGGPVEIAGTLEEGDNIAGFHVIHLPGHAHGLIGLWRESDRFAMVSDTFYTLNPETALRGAVRVPHPAFNINTEQARASIQKLADLEPSAAWSGHARGLTGDVRAQLEAALV